MEQFLFSSYFNLTETPENIDFFDIDINRDTKRFVDPFYISQINNSHCVYMKKILGVFMSELMSPLRSGDVEKAKKLCRHFSEPSGTRLGYSKVKLDGSGAGDKLAEGFVEELISSRVVKSGAVKYLEELGIVCPNIDKDRISDITINIVKHGLILFTQQQCRKLKIPIKQTNKKISYYCIENRKWVADYFDLPHVTCAESKKESHIILIPKEIIPEQVTYNYRYFYTNIAMDYFKREAIALNLPAVKKLQNGKVRVYAKILRLDVKYRGLKTNMEKFVNSHPQSLEQYRRLFAKHKFNYLNGLS